MKNAFTGLVEFSDDFSARPEISHVVFDFDGTLSLVREGWPDVMLPMFQEFLPESSQHSVEDDRKMLLDDMMKLTGKQTIYQMMQFADRVKARGGQPLDPLEYKHEYLRRLDKRIKSRHEALQSGATKRDEYLVYNSIELLEILRELGMNIYLASGTDEQFVKSEAEMLGIEEYFGPHIYGAQDDYKSFSKKMVIDRILRENSIDGSKLLSFGDGYVEIENTKEVGGLAVAVASDEANNGSGRFDLWKKERLKQVNADLFIPDFRDIKILIEIILGKREKP